MTEKEKKQTCLQCRKRKVRCDGEINGCSNCERLDFSCVFVSSNNTTPSSTSISNADLFLKNAPQECATGGATSRTKYTIGSIERRHGLRACRPCRASKSRCSGSLPTCRQCERRGLDCQYAPSRRRKNPSDTIPVAVETTHTGTQMLQADDRNLIYPARAVNGIHMGLSGDKIFVESHIDAYFESLNAIPQYSFIHKPSFLRSFHQNTLDPLLLRFICGIASRFIQPGLQQGYVAAWLKEVEAQVWPKLSEMKVGNLQILLSLICWYSVERKVSNLWTASAMAARIAYGLRLNHEASDKIPFILKETRRRLVWSIFMLDKLYAGGFPELTLCPANTLHVKLPCEEQNFELDIPVETSLLVKSGPFSEESGIGIMGYIARLMSIRHAILE
ncbi:hypothetical protein N7488_001025 [Penicillium malachiteum]|nr:hypothetical protein N7488_001025 [Penicillium malachiteum]